MIETDQKEIKVLVIADSPADSSMVCKCLNEIKQRNVKASHVNSFRKGDEFIENDGIDVVLINFKVANSRDIEPYKQFFSKFPFIPSIIMTDKRSLDVSINLLKKGAKDILLKDEIDPQSLYRSISYALERISLEGNYMRMILKVQDMEKERIALDIHDSLGQHLTSASIQLQNLRNELKSKFEDQYEEVSKSVDFSLECINESMQISRTICRTLMPKTVKKFGLESGTEGILMTMADHSKLNIEFSSNLDSKRFNENVELALFRIAQEGINNIVKHSQATKALVELEYIDNKLCLCISDNGIGFDPDDKEMEGLGMHSIRARAKAISALLEIKSRNGQGSILRISKFIQDEHSK